MRIQRPDHNVTIGAAVAGILIPAIQLWGSLAADLTPWLGFLADPTVQKLIPIVAFAGISYLIGPDRS